MKPDDLTEKEHIELQRLLHEATRPAEMKGAEPEEGSEYLELGRTVVMHGGMPWPGECQPFDVDAGTGWWKGHNFTLSPEQLKRVQAIFVERIAEELSAEVEKLKREVGDV